MINFNYSSSEFQNLDKRSEGETPEEFTVFARDH